MESGARGMESAYMVLVGIAAVILLVIPFIIIRTFGRQSRFDAFTGGPRKIVYGRRQRDVMSPRLDDRFAMDQVKLQSLSGYVPR